MDDLKIFKEKIINDYIYNNINLTSAGTNDIKNGLRNILGE